MRLVVALGGNALLQRGDPPDADIQRHHVTAAAVALAPLAAAHELIICHGNGPQVGLLALESESDPMLSRPYPLDVLGAQTQGMIGYWLSQALSDAGVDRPVVGVITQTVVDAADPAFGRPSKFIGRVYDRDEAMHLAAQHHWTVAPDGDRWRRVVPSPKPVRIIEQPSISALLSTGAVVICGGGGGVPVVAEQDGRLSGVEAVVDKDLVAGLLALETGADALLVLTDVGAVMRDFGTPRATPLSRLTVGELSGFSFPDGSMGPKIAACRQFVSATGHPAAIGALTDAAALLAGTAGTTIVADSSSALVGS